MRSANPKSSQSAISAVAVMLLAIASGASASNPVYEEQPVDREEYVDPAPALRQYMREKSRRLGLHSFGGGMDSVEGTSIDFYDLHGNRILRPGIELFQFCGTVVDEEPDPAFRGRFQAACETQFLQYMKRFTQPAEPGPYRVPAPSEVVWQEQFVTLATNQMALILDGRYTDPDQPAPCIRTPDCCNVEGLAYLDSCFPPDDAGWQAIAQCEELGLKSTAEPGSKWQQCLRDHGIRVGCEGQPDGSRICY